MHQKLRAWKRQRTQQLENFDEIKSNLEPTRTLESSETNGIRRKKGRNIIEPFDATMKDL
jgi:hypothetical protein